MAERRLLTPAAALALGFVAAGCAAKNKPSQAPMVDLRDWSLDDIEAELQRNDDVLADAGIVVARADPPPPELQPRATAEPEPEPEPGPEPGPVYDGGGDTVTDSDDAPALTSVEAEPADSAPTSRDYAEDSIELERRERGKDRRAERRRTRASDREDRQRERTRCERVCDLAEATCDLEVQICELAEEHPDEPRYEKACLRAELQCSAAMQACDTCED